MDLKAHRSKISEIGHNQQFSADFPEMQKQQKGGEVGREKQRLKPGISKAVEEDRIHQGQKERPR